MATDAVPVYVPKYGLVGNEIDYESGYIQHSKIYEPIQPLEHVNSEDFVNMKNHNKEDITTDENEEKVSDGNKKKRNPRKRNRSDMSPEELRRLRERERKAQQSRRDRIRAQKVFFFFFFF